MNKSMCGENRNVDWRLMLHSYKHQGQIQQFLKGGGGPGGGPKRQVRGNFRKKLQAKRKSPSLVLPNHDNFTNMP